MLGAVKASDEKIKGVVFAVISSVAGKSHW